MKKKVVDGPSLLKQVNFEKAEYLDAVLLTEVL